MEVTWKEELVLYESHPASDGDLCLGQKKQTSQRITSKFWIRGGGGVLLWIHFYELHCGEGRKGRVPFKSLAKVAL